MNREIYVYIELEDSPQFIGTIWTRFLRARESATFEYSKEWLNNPARFSLEPALGLGPGPFHTSEDKPLFGSIGDSAPDRWGRILMKRNELRKSKHEKRDSHTLTEADYLLQVTDVIRQGALRFSESINGPFLAEMDEHTIPPLVSLPKLLQASDRILNDAELDEDLLLLFAPGSSLGGARPKAAVQDISGRLAIAKFPSNNDEHNVVLWEAVALSLAEKSMIRVPEWRLERVGNRGVLLLYRFDRRNNTRIHFISAMSMLSAGDNESRCYLEFIDALRQWGAFPEQDIKELWRRIVFTILISNTDDHLRNHGFLYVGANGWTLSPAYDLNPVPAHVNPRYLSVELDFGDRKASIETALNIADYFELSKDESYSIIREVVRAVSNWQKVAAKSGLSQSEIERMESAFLHDDFQLACEI